MLEYAVKLNAAPHAVRREDVDALRAVGFDDAAILDVCQIVAYYAYANRLADGLGIELEATWEGRELTVTRDELVRWRSAREGAGAGAR